MTTTEPKVQTVRFRLSRDLHEALSKLAAANDRTVSAELRRAAREHIDKEAYPASAAS